METIYFAKRPALELARELETKMNAWSSAVNRNGLRTKWMKCYRMYYGRHWKGDSSYRDSEILHTGEDGELSALTVNDFRSLIKHMLVLTTNQKPAYDPRATNTDDSSVTQTRLGRNILDYYTRDKRVGRYAKRSAEMALVFGKGFMKVVWSKTAGGEFGVEDYQDSNGNPSQRVMYEGDVKVSNLDPFSVFVDQSLEDWKEVQWVITREWVNRFDIAARHPERAEEIMNLPTKKDLEGFNCLSMQTLADTDLIPEYEFYHLRCPALPNGRYTKFYSEDIVGFDDAIPYKVLPVFRIVPSDFFGSTEGYTEAFDIMNLQQAQNVLFSSFYTNQSTFGVQNILMPEGCNLSALQIAKALQVLRYNPAAGKPEALQLCSTPPELFKGIELISNKMELVFGMNSVARGNPQEELSGKAMGLLQSMAIQYASGFQESYAEMLEDVGTFILHLIRDFAKTERVISIAGKANKSDLVKFTGSDLQNIDRVVVDLGNPLSKTLAGRVDIADQLLQHNLIKNPQEYLTVIETGNLETMTEHDSSTLSQVRAENEKLSDYKGPTPQQQQEFMMAQQQWQMQAQQGAQMGMPPPPPPQMPPSIKAVIFEPHVLHIQEHQCLIANPDVKENSAIYENVMAHIQMHIDQYLSLANNPQMAQMYSLITKEPPPPPPPMPMMPPGMMPHPPPPGAEGGAHGGHKPPPHKPMNEFKTGPQQGNGRLPPIPNPQPPPGPEQALQEALK